MKQAGIYVNDNYCGLLTEDEEGFHFAYDEEYLARQDAAPVSPTMPLTKQQQGNDVPGLRRTYSGRMAFGYCLLILEN